MEKIRRIRAAFLVTLLTVVAAGDGFAQQADRKTILKLLVTDSSGFPIKNLKLEDFQVFENNKRVSLSSFAGEDVSICYGLIIDSTGSMKDELPAILKASRQIVESNTDKDKTFIIRVVGGGVLGSEWMSKKTEMLQCIDSIDRAVGASPLLEALLAAEKNFPGGPGCQNGLILLSDGLDSSQRREPDKVISQFREKGIPIIALSLAAKDNSTGPGNVFAGFRAKRAMEFLSSLSTETNGQAFFLKSSADLADVAKRVTSFFRTQYVLEYSSPARDFDLKKLKEKVKVKLAQSANGQKLTVRVLTVQG